MYCYRCGNRLPDDSAFCNRCGVRLRTTTERVRGSRPIESDPTPYFSPRQTSGRSVERFRANHHIDDDEDTATDHSDQYPSHYNQSEEWAGEEQLAEPDEWSDYEETDEDEEVDDPDEGADSPPYRGPRERVVFSINPAFYPVTNGYIFAVFIALFFAAIVSFIGLGFLVTIGGTIIAFVPAVVRHIRHLHTTFTLTNVKLEIAEGLFSKTTRNIPLRHIQDVSVKEGFRERILGIGDIILDTASMENRLILQNVNNPRHYADQIIEQLEKWI